MYEFVYIIIEYQSLSLSCRFSGISILALLGICAQGQIQGGSKGSIDPAPESYQGSQKMMY